MPDYKPLGRTFAAALGLPWDITERLVQQESGWRQFDERGHVLTSSQGALGLTQLMPDTARALGVNAMDAVQNLGGGLRYFADQIKRYGGDIVRALVAYNAGPGKADLWNRQRSSLAKETRDYLDAILGVNWDANPSPSPGWNPFPSGTDIGAGIVSSIKAWLDSLRQGFIQGARNELIDRHAPWVMGLAGIALLFIGILALVMRSPPGRIVSRAASAIPAPQTQAIGAVGATAESMA